MDADGGLRAKLNKYRFEGPCGVSDGVGCRADIDLEQRKMIAIILRVGRVVSGEHDG